MQHQVALTFSTGFGLSPLIGYKIVSNVGFTFDIQAGPVFLLSQGTASGG